MSRILLDTHARKLTMGIEFPCINGGETKRPEQSQHRGNAPAMLSMSLCNAQYVTLEKENLDEEKFKHAPLTQQNSFGQPFSYSLLRMDGKRHSKA
jgi:hypothetical protein